MIKSSSFGRTILTDGDAKNFIDHMKNDLPDAGHFSKMLTNGRKILQDTQQQENKIMKSKKEIKPFAIDCSGFDKQTVQMIIDKMLEAGIRKYDTLNSFTLEWNYFKYWGYNADYGTYAGNLNPTGKWFNSSEIITLDQLDDWLGLNPCNSLRNVKIDLRDEIGNVDEELSKVFQEAVFESGGKWRSGTKAVVLTTEPFIFVNNNGGMSSTRNVDVFNNSDWKQITFSYKRSFEWKAEFIEEAKREIIELPNGDKYYADDLQEALSKLKKIG